MQDTITLDDIRIEAEYEITYGDHSAVKSYLRDKGDGLDDSPDLRYAAADHLIEVIDGAVEYDEQHGVDDGVSDMEIRTPAYAAIHTALSGAWYSRHT